MRLRKITKADACYISGYERDELSYVLKEVPPYSTQKTTARVARELAPLDLLALSVIYVLDKSYGLRLRTIARISDQLRQVLAVPRAVNANAGLAISVSPPFIDFVELPTPVSGGIIVPLKDIFERIDHFCNAFRIEAKPAQSELGLGPGLVKAPKAKVSVR